MNHHLIVISLLDGHGPTGVEAHFNQLIHHAQAYGITSQLVSAYPARRLWASLARRLVPALRMIDRERASVLSLWINSKVIEAKLADLTAQASERGDAITLYAQDPWCAQLALGAGKHRRCRVVAVVHYNISQTEELILKGEARADGPVARLLGAAEVHALPQVDHLIFVSAFMQRELRARVAGLRIVAQSVIPNLSTPASTQADADAGGADLIAIGTLEARKNQAFLLRVLAKANALGFRYTLTIVGDGPDQARLEALSSQLGLQEQVRFAGRQPHAATLIPRHRLLVHAALMENMPVALIEALAAGRPILAPAVGGIVEIFNDGVEGCFWPLDDVDAAAGLLIRVLSDSGAYQRMTQAALARYRLKFDHAVLLAEWLSTVTDKPCPPASASMHAGAHAAGSPGALEALP